METDLERKVRLFAAGALSFHALIRGVESTLVRRHAPAAEKVLDLGCGDGLFAALTLPTPVAYGLDPDPEAIGRARRGGAHECLFQASADRIPLPDGACDLVLANSVLEHIPDLDPALAEIRRVLRAGGRLVMTAPGDRFGEDLGLCAGLEFFGLTAWARSYRVWFNGISKHHHLDGAAAWQARLEGRGFRVAHYEPYFSRRAMRWFDLLHFVSVPSLLTRKLLGRWHLLGRPLFASPWRSFLQRMAQHPPPEEEGACVFIVAEAR